MNVTTQIDNLLQEALEAHREADEKFRKGIARAFDCGIAFLKLHQHCELNRPGEFSDLIALSEKEISRRTVYYYMAQSSALLNWAEEANPRLKDPATIEAFARQTILKSGLTLMNLLRSLKIIEEKAPGGRASEKHKENQLEFPFNWSVFDSTLWAFERDGIKVLKDVPTDELQMTCTRMEVALQLTKQELTGRILQEPERPVRTERTEDKKNLAIIGGKTPLQNENQQQGET